jgi:hypothetical protein
MFGVLKLPEIGELADQAAVSFAFASGRIF